MTNAPVVELLTNRFANLAHPDGQPVRFAAATNAGTLPPAMAEQVNRSVTRLATAVVHTIETEGYTIVRDDELAAVTHRATETDPAKPVRVQCNTCGGLLFDLNLTAPTMASVSGSALRNYFRGEASEGCACE